MELTVLHYKSKRILSLGGQVLLLKVSHSAFLLQATGSALEGNQCWQKNENEVPIDAHYSALQAKSLVRVYACGVYGHRALGHRMKNCPARIPFGAQ